MKNAELIQDLVNAVKNREHHKQEVYSCGTSCCIAGTKVIRDFPWLRELLPDAVMGYASELPTPHYFSKEEVYAWSYPWNYAKNAFDLSGKMADLIFDAFATVYCHVLAVFFLETGLGDSLDFCWKSNSRGYLDQRNHFERFSIGGTHITNLDLNRSLPSLLNEICGLLQINMPPITQQLLDEVFANSPKEDEEDD